MARPDPFPSLSKRPLPMPHTETGRSTLSFHPDRPVFWDDKGKEKFATPEEARIRPLKSGSSGHVLQGMLFKPETLEEHWNTPERHAAVNRLNLQTNPPDWDMHNTDTTPLDYIAHTVRTSRMPTSLIHEFADSDITIRPGTGEGLDESRTGYRGLYNSRSKTAFVGDGYESGVVMHELGHGMHDLTGRSRHPAETEYGHNRTQSVEGGADPLLEGVAEGLARRYATNKKSSISYDNRAYKGWYGKGGHELYKQLKDSVSQTGHIPIINPRLLYPLFDRQKETTEQRNAKVYDRVKTLTANTNPEYSEEAIANKVKENNRVMRGWTDTPMHQPTLWE